MAIKVYIPAVTSPQVFATIGGALLEQHSSWRMQNWETSLKLSIDAYEKSMDKYKAELKAQADLEGALDKQLSDLNKDIDRLQKENRDKDFKLESFNASKKQSADTTNANIAAGNERAKFYAKATAGRQDFQYESTGSLASPDAQRMGMATQSLPWDERKQKVQADPLLGSKDYDQALTESLKLNKQKLMKAGIPESDAEGMVLEEIPNKTEREKFAGILGGKRATSGGAGAGDARVPDLKGSGVSAQQLERKYVDDPLGRTDTSGKVYQVTEEEAEIIKKQQQKLELEKQKESVVKDRPTAPKADVLENARTMYETFEKLPAREVKAKLEKLAAIKAELDLVKKETDKTKQEAALSAFRSKYGFSAPPSSSPAPTEPSIESRALAPDVYTRYMELRTKPNLLGRITKNTDAGRDAAIAFNEIAQQTPNKNDTDIQRILEKARAMPRNPKDKAEFEAALATLAVNAGYQFEPQRVTIVTTPKAVTTAPWDNKTQRIIDVTKDKPEKFELALKTPTGMQATAIATANQDKTLDYLLELTKKDPTLSALTLAYAINKQGKTLKPLSETPETKPDVSRREKVIEELKK